MKKSFAFTLAEVLITLTVLGALAAMTVPTLTYNYRSKLLETQFRDTYNDIRELGTALNNEYGDMGEFAHGSYSGGDKHNNAINIFPRKVISLLHGGGSFNASATWENQDDPNYDPTKDISVELQRILGQAKMSAFGSPDRATGYTVCDNAGIWQDLKGRIWTFNGEYNLVCVDVNGSEQPNTFNVDRFVFAPMSAIEVGTWVFKDPNANQHKNEYTAQFVLCDGSMIERHNNSNWNDRSHTDSFTGEEINEVESHICAYEENPGNKSCALNYCPFNYPIYDIAPPESKAVKQEWGYLVDRLGHKITKAHPTYWKDYVRYK